MIRIPSLQQIFFYLRMILLYEIKVTALSQFIAQAAVAHTFLEPTDSYLAVRGSSTVPAPSAHNVCLYALQTFCEFAKIKLFRKPLLKRVTLDHLLKSSGQFRYCSVTASATTAPNSTITNLTSNIFEGLRSHLRVLPIIQSITFTGIKRFATSMRERARYIGNQPIRPIKISPQT